MATPPFTSRHRRPLLGYAMVMAAATLFALNGTVSKVILASGLSEARLAEIRVTGAALALLAALALTRPATLALRAREIPFLIVFGTFGLALNQLFYFLAIRRLELGIALLIQYLAPLLVALWARFVMHERVRARIWAALALALVGLSLVVEVGQRGGFSGFGMAAALAGAFAFAAYILLAERAIAGRDSVSLSCYGFVFAALFWAVVQPWWSFPAGQVADDVSLLGNLADFDLPVWALVTWVILLGTIAPFGLFVAALRHISATRVGIGAMLEPVVAAAIAWAWLEESLGPPQLIGGLVVLAGIGLAQSARS